MPTGTTSSNINNSNNNNTNATTRGGVNYNNTSNSYESEAFSSNVTPPLNFKEVNGIKQQPPIFGGNTRATTVIETQLQIPNDDGEVGDVIIPSFSQLQHKTNKNKNTPSSPSRRLSFAFATSSDPSETPSVTTSKRGATTTYTYGGTSDKSNSKVKSSLPGPDITGNAGTPTAIIPPPAIPDELFAALSLPPGTAINASTIKRAAETASSSSSRSAAQHAKLPSLESFSPFNLKSPDAPWAASASSSSSTSSPSNSSFTNSSGKQVRNQEHGNISSKSSSNSLRKRAILEASSSNPEHAPATPLVTPATPSPRAAFLTASPDLSSDSSASNNQNNNNRRNLRKAASAESLRTNYSTATRDMDASTATTAFNAIKGLGILGTTTTISTRQRDAQEAAETALPSDSNAPAAAAAHQHGQHSKADMKSIFKSFSAKLHIRPSASSSSSPSPNDASYAGNTAKEREQHRYPSLADIVASSSLSPSSSRSNNNNATLAAPLGNTNANSSIGGVVGNNNSITIGRKSFDSSFRHSLSLYPRRSSEKLPPPPPSSVASGSTSGGERESVSFPRSKSEKNVLDPEHIVRSSTLKHTTMRGSIKGKMSNSNLTLKEIHRNLGDASEIEDGHEREAATWLSREQFTHDLSQRNKKNKRASGSGLSATRSSPPRHAATASVGAGYNLQGQGQDQGQAAPMSGSQEVEDTENNVDEEEDESDEEDDEASELASQMSYVDSVDLPPSQSELEILDDTVPIYSSSTAEIQARRSPLRRNTSPVNMMNSAGAIGMAATLQRNRADSDLLIPPRISTDSSGRPDAARGSVDGRREERDLQEEGKRLTPPAMTPDTASTIYMDAFSTPLMSPALSPSQHNTFTIFPTTPTGTPLKNGGNTPPSPVHTVRPRSMSESHISSVLTMSHAAEVRAPQPNKSTVLNGAMLSDYNQRIMEEHDEDEMDLQNAGHEQDEDVRQVSFGQTDMVRGGPSARGLDDSRRTSASSSRRGSHSTQLSPSKKSSPDYVVAIVGPKQVGKSTIIANNLKLSGDRCSLLYEDEHGNKVISYSGSYSITGTTCTIQILEVDMDLLKSTSEGLTWPANVPRPEGVMICYKYGDPKGLEQLKTLLHGFWTRGGIHLIALATQCPTIQEGAMPYKAEGDKAAEICNIHGAGLVHLDGGIQDPNRKARNSLQWILRKILESRGQGSRSPSRAKKLVSSKRSVAALIAEKSAVKASATELAGKDINATIRSASDATHSLKTMSTLSVNSAQSGEPSLEAESTPSKHGHSLTDIYLSRDNLVQKALFAAVTGNDEEFIESFLIVFRRFETPYQVLNSWMERFNMAGLHLDSDPLLSRQIHMSLCKLLTRWLKFHPHDFCGPCTNSLLNAILTKLYTHTWVIHYAMEIEELMKGLSKMMDHDSAWTLPDGEEVTPLHELLLAESLAIERRPSLVPSIGSAKTSGSLPLSVQTSINLGSQGSYGIDTESISSTSKHASSVSLPGASRIGSSASPTRSTFTSASSPTSSSLSPHGSNQAISKQHRLAATLELSNTILEVPVQALARQITKHVWDIFASMQPRDLLRYVMTPRDPKNPDARPQRDAESPITKAVAFSNYLSNWTASLLLVQSKQKTRARIYEYLIHLALALRALDNLDSLMAVLVGLNSTPVHRLHDLPTSVTEQIYKKFRSMNRLMASTRSFAAYRLALTTTRPEVIPYLGVHLQDITRVHDGKSDMRDGLVNWSKMRQIGQYASNIAHCARLTPHYTHDERLSKLVLDAPVFSLDNDDDTLYELSYSYKPRQKKSGSGSQTAKLKRLFKEAIGTPSLSPFNQSTAVS